MADITDTLQALVQEQTQLRLTALDIMAQAAIVYCMQREIAITRLVLIEERLPTSTRWHFEIRDVEYGSVWEPVLPR